MPKTILFASVLALTMVTASQAASPQMINYQGRLTDGGGSPVADATYSVVFTIYDAATAGTSVWTETQNVTTADGLFAVLLGSINPILDTVFNEIMRYLGIEVAGDPEINPRAAFATAPYSFRTATVDGATGGIISGDVSIQSDLDIDGDLRATGKATIGPGHTNTGTDAFVAGANNRARGDYSVVSGGGGATAIDSNLGVGDWSTVSGGRRNVAEHEAAVGGGFFNRASGSWSVIGGGNSHNASGGNSTIGGGFGNTASAPWATIGGGSINLASDSGATVSGGQYNKAHGIYSVVAGGGGTLAVDSNSASGAFSAIGGGSGNIASGDSSVVSGGTHNAASGLSATVGGGKLNLASGNHSVISGGLSDSVTGEWGTIGGGWKNAASNVFPTVGGGFRNVASNEAATIGGGRTNNASGRAATVGGGDSNDATGEIATISGGHNNNATAFGATISGGEDNDATGNNSTVGGGFNNTASGVCSFIAGGCGNIVVGANSFAGGSNAFAKHDGSFVWADGSGNQLQTTEANQFMVRAAGGIKIYSNPELTGGVTIRPGASAWAVNSDRDIKENFSAVNGKELLEKNAMLPIMQWNYISQSENIRHIGPMAQDFCAIFGFGDDSLTISTIDPDGVALAAIQELYKENKELKHRLEKLEAKMNSSEDAQ